MKAQISIFFLAVSILSLSACETHQHANQQPVRGVVKQDFLTTGRGLSNGAVDLYQPGTDFLPNTGTASVTPGTRISAIPANSNVMVNDPSVTIYNLDVEHVSEPEPAPLPPLQPPTVLRADYPSPFDQNGNPSK